MASKSRRDATSDMRRSARGALHVFAIVACALSSISCTGDDTFGKGEEEEPRPREGLCTPAISDSVELTPNPYTASGSFIPRTSAFEAQFNRLTSGATPATFSVRGLQSGGQFRGQSYSGNGTTRITTPPTAFVPGEEVEVVITDALLCPGGRTARLRVASLLNAAADSFSAQRLFAVGRGPSGVAAGDLNNDGRLDLAVSMFTDTVSVLLGNGDGTFRPRTTFIAGRQVVSSALGDINRDGFLDIVTANFSAQTVSVLLGNGDGSFRAARNFPVPSSARALAVGDLNQDGFLDVAVAVNNNVAVMLGTGNATLLGSAGAFAVDGNMSSVALGDLNRDGALDLVLANPLGSVSVELGNGDGTFRLTNEIPVDSPFQVAIGDLNNDGIPDLAAANGNRTFVTVLIGVGNGSFRDVHNETVGSEPESLAIGDVNGDGRLDLVVPNNDSDNLSVLLGNGDGTFRPRPLVRVGGSPGAVALADFNNDGLLDAAVANFIDENVSVLLGRQ